MRKFLLLLLCFLIIFVAGCTVDDKVEMVKESTIEEPVPVAEENITEDLTMELKPIKQFSNYVVSPNAIYGIDEIRLEKVHLNDTEDEEHLFDTFFALNNITYFTVKYIAYGDPIPDTDPVQYETVEEIHYFEQAGDKIAEITEAAFPISSASEYIEFEGGDYSIITFPYEKDGETTITSRVSQGLSIVGYLKIDGCVLVNDGLWYSVAERIQTRLEGVYYWPIGGQPRRVLESGRIY